jgi:glycosyltransferase involved in cell wall biosynthesis
MLRSSHAVCVYTDEGRLRLLNLDVDPARVFVLLNTLDVTYLRSILPGMHMEPRVGGGPKLLVVARLNPVKRVGSVVEIVRELNRRGLNCSLTIVGDGPDRPLVEAAAASNDWVTIESETFDPRVLAAKFAAADLLIIPGRVGLSAIHAFAYGLPVVTASADLVEQSPEFEYLVNGSNALIVDSLDPLAFADSIEALWGDRQAMTNLRRGAYETATELTMERMAGTFISALSQAARPRRGTSS